MSSRLGFTHIEFLPITEHPYDPSWGYQTTGLLRPDGALRRAGRLCPLRRRRASRRHRRHPRLGAGAFPGRRSMACAQFDGTALYEHADPRQGFHPDWNTAIYNFGRREVISFLVNNALYWAEKFHVDGLRVDAVASMLYLDYSRKDGEWIPNETGRPRESRGRRASCRR